MIKLLIEYIFSTYYKYYIYDKQHIIYYQYKQTKFYLPCFLQRCRCR